MSTEIPIWVNGTIRWVSGIDRKTTCRDVVEVLLAGEGMSKSDVKDFTIMERWRRVERPLDENSKIFKVWSHWGDEKKEVRLCLRRIDNEVDSGRGSPIGAGATPSLRRRRHRSRTSGKPPWSHQETLHPRRLAELGGFNKDEYEEYQLRRLEQMESSDSKMAEPIYESRRCAFGENIYGKRHDFENSRRKSGHKNHHCSGTGMLHSTLLTNTDHYSKPTTSKCCSKRPGKQKVRNSENIEKLMKLILAQGATIQNQLQKLKEREQQIESIEHERHRERIEKNGRNYLLETYLGSLNEAEVPTMVEVDEEKGNDSGVHTEGGSDQMNPAWEKEREKRERLGEKETEHTNKHISRRGRLKQTQTNETIAVSDMTKQDKAKRSKSESRTHDCDGKELNKSLKRTKSENSLVGNCEVKSEEKPEENAKEADGTVELRRIQSQVEMWEKVFKINKKLEKEEENLVRLHIKIKRFQSENLKIAKEQQDTEAKTPKTDETVSKDETDCKSIEKNLEVLRSDLDQNSKEIYQNFSKLIEDDEVVERKKDYLTMLMTDLERTEQEHNMLNEMVTMVEERAIADDQIDNIGISLQVKGQEKVPDVIPPTCHTPLTSFRGESLPQRNLATEMSSFIPQGSKPEPVPQTADVAVAQEPDLDQIKPKTVKISFDDQIQNSENLPNGHEKAKEPTPSPSGAIKGILKNRNRAAEKAIGPCNYNLELHHFEKCSVGYGSNIDQHVDKLPGNYQKDFSRVCRYPNAQETTENQHQIYSYPINAAYNNPIYGQGPNHYVESPGMKSTYPFKTQHPPGMCKTNTFQNGTIVTTKAVVHNDTDSSTSSDTSGLSSMYSSSPTVEEPYAEGGYVLDTLV